MEKKREPFFALLLSLFLPGLGQIYNTQLLKGIIFFTFSYLLLTLFSYARLYHTLYGLLALLILGSVIYWGIAIEAAVTARKKRVIELKSYNKWYIYLLIYIFIILFNSTVGEALQINTIGIQAYKISSGSMLPTMEIGDHFIIDLNTYRKIKPAYGDIIIFQYPVNPEQNYIMRIIATGGDEIKILNKKVYINGTPIDEQYVIHLDSRILPGNLQPRDNMVPTKVPMDSYFVLGDNRDNSYDSRFWGFVESDAIKGKALYYYWSWDKSKSKVRWDKIGKKIK